MTLIEIHTGIHTGGKTTAISKKINEDKYVSIPESVWLHDYATAKTDECKDKLKESIIKEFLTYDNIYKPLKDILNNRIENDTLSNTSDLHTIMIYFYVELLKKISNKNRNVNLLLDRCIVDSLYYNNFEDKELDDIVCEYTTEYFIKLITFYRIKSIDVYKYGSLSYEHHIERLNKRNRLTGDIKISKDEYNDMLFRINKLCDVYIINILKSIKINVNLFDVKTKRNEKGILINYYNKKTIQ